MENKNPAGTKRSVINPVILMISFILIAAVLLWAFLSSKNLAAIPYSIENWRADHLVYRDSAFFLDDSRKDDGVYGEILWGPYKELKKGSYTIQIDYSAEEDQSCLVTSPHPEKRFIKATTGLLSRYLHSVSYEFEVSEDIENFEFLIYYNGTGDFSIRSISVNANNNRSQRIAAEVIAAVLLFNGGFAFMGLPDHKKKILLALAGITILSSLPAAIRGLPSGHDLEVHLLRIEAIVQALRSGQFPARISSMVLYGQGYPFSIFYNDILLYLPAVLRLLGFSVITSYKVYILFINLLTVVLSYYSFTGIFKNRNTGLLLTLLYTTASYRLVNIYVREAVGEFSSQAFLPLLGLALHNIFRTDRSSGKEIFRNGVLLALAMSGLIGSHIPSTVMAVFVIFLVCIFCLKKLFTKQVLASLALAVLLCIILNLYFIVPFADFYFNTPTTIKGQVDQDFLLMQVRGAYPAQLFGFFQNACGMADNLIPERLQVTPGLPLMSMLIISLLLWLFKKGHSEFHFALFFSAITLLLSLDIFPWDRLAWHFPVMRVMVQMVQFPWRFLGFAVLFLTLLSGEFFRIADSARIRFGLGSAAVIMTFWVMGSIFGNCEIVDVYDTSGIDRSSIGSGTQYMLQGSSFSQMDTELKSEGMQSVVILSQKSDRMKLSCRAGEDGGKHAVTVPLYNYKGYHVFDESGNELEILNGEQNHISFELNDNYEGTVSIQYRDPAYWTAALLISLAAACCITGREIYCAVKSRRKQHL